MHSSLLYTLPPMIWYLVTLATSAARRTMSRVTPPAAEKGARSWVVL